MDDRLSQLSGVSDFVSEQTLEYLINEFPHDEFSRTEHLMQNPCPNNLDDYEEMCHSTQEQKGSISSTVSPTGVLPSMDEFHGAYNFKIELSDSSVNSWVYSSQLERVFINMNKVLIVKFHVDRPEPGMSIRALPVFSEADYIGEPVSRCPVHAIEDDPISSAHAQDGVCLCTDYRLAGHVVRVYSVNAVYCYNGESERHSVKVPVITPHPGSHFMDIPFTFACKTSCPRGMQRRPIHVIFTLENSNGEVVGRRTLAVKICSCPKRDCSRLEKDLQPEEKPTPAKQLMTNSNCHSQKTLNTVKLEPHTSHSSAVNLMEEIKELMDQWRHDAAQRINRIETLLNDFIKLHKNNPNNC